MQTESIPAVADDSLSFLTPSGKLPFAPLSTACPRATLAGSRSSNSTCYIPA